MYEYPDSRRAETRDVLIMRIAVLVSSPSSCSFICVHKHAQDASAVDVRTNVYANESTESIAVTKKAVSTQRTPAAKKPTIENTSSNRRKPTQVTSVHVQASERTRKENDGSSSTSKVEDEVYHSDRVERTSNQPQPFAQILPNASRDTTLGTSLSLEQKQGILSSKSSEASTDTRSVERLDRVTVAEEQLDRVSGVHKFGAASARDAPVTEKTSATTVYNVVGVAIDRADVISRCVM